MTRQSEIKSISFSKIDGIPFVQAIRRGFVLLTPVLMIGSFMLILKFLPIAFYQNFIQTFAGGFLITLFTMINEATFGILSLLVTISISISYARLKTSQSVYIFGAVMAALGSYMLFNGLFTEQFTRTSFGAQGMFTAIFSAVFASSLFMRLAMGDRFSFRLYTVGADTDFNHAMSIIVPVGIVIFASYLLNTLIMTVFGVHSLEQLIHDSVTDFFDLIQSKSVRIVLYTFFSSVFWFFGIHGTNVLESALDSIFSGAATGVSEILSKSFMDVFVFMGGCGATLSLLIAILLFSKQKSTKSLAKMAALPMAFNINELMVYGLPIVFNPAFLIPFITVPLLNMGTSFLAVWLGLVPLPVYSIEWVTPVIIGGFQATGSIAGALLQAFNLALGAFVYRWFLLRYEKQTNERIQSDLKSLIATVREAEDAGAHLTLLELPGNKGAIAKMLAEDLRHLIKVRESFVLFYQPQYDAFDRCVGIEALLRWNHPRCGIIYPPLVFSIAQEIGLLDTLEREVFRIACEDMKILADKDLKPERVSVNITAPTLQSDAFVEYLKGLLMAHPHMQSTLAIELTEQSSFRLNDAVEARLTRLRDMGIGFAIDDFSAGQTSLKYLQTSQFDEVKLDGALVKDMMENQRSQEIIASIVHMASTMNFTVIAEYVETTAQRDKLCELGCMRYQGYLFAPALRLDRLCERMQAEQSGYEPDAHRETLPPPSA